MIQNKFISHCEKKGLIQLQFVPTMKKRGGILLGFLEDEIVALVVGASGGIGDAFVQKLSRSQQCTSLIMTSRQPQVLGSIDAKHTWLSLDITEEASIQHLSMYLQNNHLQPNVVLNLSGMLHCSQFGPERTWRHLDMETMRRVFEVNTFGIALLAKHLIPMMPRTGRSIFASLSARVGSISDNKLGGWYSYRASKAAQNMIVKNISIEAQRKWKQLICVALHPGTVKTSLSDPFTKNYDPQKLFTPQQSCDFLCDVISHLTMEDTGGFFAWDGQPIEF